LKQQILQNYLERVQLPMVGSREQWIQHKNLPIYREFLSKQAPLRLDLVKSLLQQEGELPLNLTKQLYLFRFFFLGLVRGQPEHRSSFQHFLDSASRDLLASTGQAEELEPLVKEEEAMATLEERLGEVEEALVGLITRHEEALEMAEGLRATIDLQSGRIVELERQVRELEFRNSA